MTHDPVLFAELLCARLCHDMAGAVGAAAAGAELLQDDLDAETARLVGDSAAGAVARLKFFRAALGPAGSPQPDTVVRDLAAAYLRAADPGLSLRWTCHRPRLDGDTARLVLNLILVARDGLVRGGEIAVEIAAAPPSGGAGLAVAFHGAGARLSEDSAATLLAGAAPAGPRDAQAGLTRCLAERIGGTLHLEALENGGRIVA